MMGMQLFFIDGTAEVEKTLSLKENHADPDREGNLSYRWRRSLDSNTWREVGTNVSYEVAASEEGK